MEKKEKARPQKKVLSAFRGSKATDPSLCTHKKNVIRAAERNRRRQGGGEEEPTCIRKAGHMEYSSGPNLKQTVLKKKRRRKRTGQTDQENQSAQSETTLVRKK